MKVLSEEKTLELQHKAEDRLPQHIGKRVARKVFEDRGNHSEAHIKEEELAAIVESAVRVYRSLTK
jgi:hypothetical protein